MSTDIVAPVAPAYPGERPEWAVRAEPYLFDAYDGASGSWTYELEGRHATLDTSESGIPGFEVWVWRFDVYKDGSLTPGDMKVCIQCAWEDQTIDLPLFYLGCLRNAMLTEAIAGVGADEIVLSYNGLRERGVR